MTSAELRTCRHECETDRFTDKRLALQRNRVVILRTYYFLYRINLTRSQKYMTFKAYT